jgi:long-chain fatty acid transport protein
MSTPTFRPRRVAVAVAATFALAAGQAYGAAFALQENSGSGLGNAFAAGAAGSEDVSSMWANPASLSKRMTMEGAGAIHFVTPSIKFRDEGSAAAFNQPLGGTGGNAGSTNIVPNLYIAVPINKQWVFGLGVNAPFGLVTEWDSDWLGRYQGVKSDVKTINVNPAISWKPTDSIAIGLGANWQRIDAEFTQKANYSGGLLTAAQLNGIPAGSPTFNAIAAATPGLDSSATIKGDDSAWGWNLGILIDLARNTQVGLAYRSEIKYKISGNANFDNPTPVVPPALAGVVGQLANGVNTQFLYNSGITSDIKLPAIFNASIFHQLNDRWDLMADVQWTGWSSIKELKFTRTQASALCPEPCVLQNTPENFDDAWRVSAGANYRYNDQWKFRGGIAWDQTPVNEQDRSVRLPDQDRWWLSAGAQYKMSNNLKFDAGFTYIFVKDASINQTGGDPLRYGVVKGSFDANVTIFSVQGTYTF